MGIHKTPGELCAKSRSKKKLHSSKSVLGRKRKANSQVWRIASWNLHGGLMAPVKSIMVSQDLSALSIDFVALQETQCKLDVVQSLGHQYQVILFPKGSATGLGFAVANSQWSKLRPGKIQSSQRSFIFSFKKCFLCTWVSMRW